MTSVQDGGRLGWQRFGVPVCGAMDLGALAVANILAGNSETEAALELTGAGCTVRFESPNIFAISGLTFRRSSINSPLRQTGLIWQKKATFCSSALPKMASAAFWPSPAGSICRPSWAAARPMSKAASAGSAAVF